jgi:hypothetical protein
MEHGMVMQFDFPELESEFPLAVYPSVRPCRIPPVHNESYRDKQTVPQPIELPDGRA